MATSMGRWGDSVEREELATLDNPVSLGSRHYPTRHDIFTNTVENSFEAMGFELANWRFQLSSDKAKMFAMFNIQSGDQRFTTDSWHLTGAVINTTNQSMSTRVLFGDETFVCTNLQFSAEFMIKRKSTQDGLQDLKHLIWDNAMKIPETFATIAERKKLMHNFDLSSDAQVNDILVRMAKKGHTTWQSIPHVLKHWEEPEHNEFKDRNGLSLFNAFTSEWRGTNPFELHNKSKRVMNFILDEVDAEYAHEAAPSQESTPEEIQDDWEHATSDWP